MVVIRVGGHDVAGVPWGDLDPETWHAASPEVVDELAGKGVEIPRIG